MTLPTVYTINSKSLALLFFLQNRFRIHGSYNQKKVFGLKIFFIKTALRGGLVQAKPQCSTVTFQHLLFESDQDQDGSLSKEEILEKYDLFVGSQVIFRILLSQPSWPTPSISPSRSLQYNHQSPAKTSSLVLISISSSHLFISAFTTFPSRQLTSGRPCRGMTSSRRFYAALARIKD